MRVTPCVLFSTLLLSSLARAADDDGLTAEKVGKIQYDEQKAGEQVDAKYGNRKASEMDSSERAEYFQDKQAAAREAHEKDGVSDKDLSIYRARMSPDAKKDADSAQRAAEKKDLKKELKDEDKKDDGPKVVAYDGSAVPGGGGAAASAGPPATSAVPASRVPARPARGVQSNPTRSKRRPPQPE